MKFFRYLDQGIEKGVAFLLVISVALMLGLAVTTIVLRWFYISYSWLDPFVRHLVFLCTFLGGIMATGKGSHIGIDILSRALEAKNKIQWQMAVRTFVSLASFLTLIWLTHACYKLTVEEFKYAKEVFLGIHSGFMVAIAPVGFILIAYRFFYIFLSSLVTLITGDEI